MKLSIQREIPPSYINYNYTTYGQEPAKYYVFNSNIKL